MAVGSLKGRGLGLGSGADPWNGAPSSSRTLTWSLCKENRTAEDPFSQTGSKAKMATRLLDLPACIAEDCLEQPLGIGFGKDQAALLAAVNGALAAMRRDGTMNQLKEKWAVP